MGKTQTPTISPVPIMSFAPGSPRLPSPPPVAEIPKSPSGGAAATLHMSQAEQSLLDANSRRRIHPGTKAADMAAGPPLVALNELDSAFQLQEHLAALHHHHTESNTKPIDRDSAIQLAQPPPGIDKTLWLYELCRFLISQCNSLIVGFLFDSPPCSASTCPEMRASEWQFLCAVHESPKSRCAIDYCCHTLDWATNIVTSQKIFPSRLSLGAGDAVDERGAGVKHLTNIFRRLHRIFAHAWFQHRGVFWQVEGQTGLYVLFKTVCDTYDLLPAENYKLPPEAEGLEPAEELRAPVPSIMKAAPTPGNIFLNDDESSRKNTRRHIRQSPSVGSAVTTVLESDEEDETQQDEEKISAPAEADEQNHEPPAKSTSSSSSWDSMSSEVEEKSRLRPQTPEDMLVQDPVAETPDEAQGEALVSMVAEPDESPPPERGAVEGISQKVEENLEEDKSEEMEEDKIVERVSEKPDEGKKVEES